jgi:hypothetical protein
MKGIRGKRAAEAAARAEQAVPPAAPEAIAPVPPAAHDPEDAPPVISAQILGQADTAETANSANIAGKARAVYLGVEWSGPADRRNRRGRIAKTEV